MAATAAIFPTTVAAIVAVVVLVFVVGWSGRHRGMWLRS
jgi:hypothetical protein